MTMMHEDSTDDRVQAQTGAVPLICTADADAVVVVVVAAIRQGPFDSKVNNNNQQAISEFE